MKKKSKKEIFKGYASIVANGKLPEKKSKRIRPMFQTNGDPSEKAVQCECKGALKSVGAFCFTITAGKLYTFTGKLVTLAPIGTGDIVGMLPGGKYIEVECKHRNGGYLSPEQYDHGIDIVNKGGTYLVVCSGRELLFKLAERKLIPSFDL